jgi:hypothetical protein
MGGKLEAMILYPYPAVIIVKVDLIFSLVFKLTIRKRGKKLRWSKTAIFLSQGKMGE